MISGVTAPFPGAMKPVASGSVANEKPSASREAPGDVSALTQGDQVTISKDARRLHQAEGVEKSANETSRLPAGSEETLTDEEQREVEQLKQRESEVRAHEQAHKAAGGQYAGAPTYGYTVGPDGRRYITDGEVSINASEVPNDPQATINKMQVIKRAALAPANPSSQDRAVYAQASRREMSAQSELRAEKAQQAQAALEGAAPGDLVTSIA